MSNESAKILDDITRIASNAIGVASESGKALNDKLKSQIKSALQELDFVSREEFEVVKLMVEKARMENEELKNRLSKLEKPSTAKAKKQTKSKK